jgi:hypothetical protein
MALQKHMFEGVVSILMVDLRDSRPEQFQVRIYAIALDGRERNVFNRPVPAAGLVRVFRRWFRNLVVWQNSAGSATATSRLESSALHENHCVSSSCKNVHRLEISRQLLQSLRIASPRLP